MRVAVGLLVGLVLCQGRRRVVPERAVVIYCSPSTPLALRIAALLPGGTLLLPMWRMRATALI